MRVIFMVPQKWEFWLWGLRVNIVGTLYVPYFYGNLRVCIYGAGLDINFLRHLPCGQVPQGFHLPKQVYTGRPGK